MVIASDLTRKLDKQEDGEGSKSNRKHPSNL